MIGKSPIKSKNLWNDDKSPFEQIHFIQHCSERGRAQIETEFTKDTPYLTYTGKQNVVYYEKFDTQAVL